jgi:nucleoside-diphosphate-sugar epimerase
MIELIGYTGFVGKSLLKNFNIENVLVNKVSLRNENFVMKIQNTKSNVLINTTGKAHDLKNVFSSDEYYKVNTELIKKLFDAFLVSKSKVFITLSSVKAVADEVNGELTEFVIPNPITHYGKSKLQAEQYILSKQIPEGKRVYILRPCMIHGPGNKGNLNVLYNLVSKGLLWPLGSFTNSRSYLSIDNLCFVIKELIEREDIPSGVFNVADDVPLSTNEVVRIIAESIDKKVSILNINKSFIKILARLGDFLKFPLNSERLQKLTESYVVSNAKIKAALAKPLPVDSKVGLMKTFQSFAENE